MNARLLDVTKKPCNFRCDGGKQGVFAKELVRQLEVGLFPQYPLLRGGRWDEKINQKRPKLPTYIVHEVHPHGMSLSGHSK